MAAQSRQALAVWGMVATTQHIRPGPALRQTLTFEPMLVTPSLLQHLAQLSRLHFTEEEMATMQQDMERMTSFVAQLQTLDTTGVPPLQHMAEHSLQLHPDEAVDAPTNWQPTALAGQQRDGYFLVPTVIERQ